MTRARHWPMWRVQRIRKAGNVDSSHWTRSPNERDCSQNGLFMNASDAALRDAVALSMANLVWRVFETTPNPRRASTPTVLHFI